MLIPELPDQHTDILLHKFYCTCLAEQMTDMEIVSRIRLYGVQSGSTAATGVDVLQNYGMDAAGMVHLQADRATKREHLDVQVGSKRKAAAAAEAGHLEVVAAERTDMTRFPVMFGGIARPTIGGTNE